ncbi:zinc ribbon domain-containing protein [Streptomyces sp. NPDC055955]|uniref:zinc ribbon domain-containing protein n=1 Tax=Streptomyces sp. NPDC055955 TaxID=3345665 RepID=UPI0035D8BF2D
MAPCALGTWREPSDKRNRASAARPEPNGSPQRAEQRAGKEARTPKEPVVIAVTNSPHSSWAFAQLGEFIAYKARKAGVPVVHVDAAYTSRTCAECGHLDKANRASQARFVCRSCGFVDHADRWGYPLLERS